MSYLYAEMADWEPKSNLPIGNETCPYCEKDILICEQMEDGPLESIEQCECPWCGKEFSVDVEYEPVFCIRDTYESR